MTAKKSKKPIEASAFIHGRKEIKGKGDNSDVTTSVKFDKVLGNVSKLNLRVATFYAEPTIPDDVAGYRVTIKPVTQEDLDEAFEQVFGA